MEKKIKPLLKWTGGKYREFALFESHIPKFERYIEPFFGGGGVFFALKPNTPSFINDKSTDLIEFYRQLSNPLFKAEMERYVNAWEAITKAKNDLWSIYEPSFTGIIKGEDLSVTLITSIDDDLQITFGQYPILTDREFLVDPSLFRKRIKQSILEKAKRIFNITLSEKRVFTDKEVKIHFETAIKSGLYLHFRRLFNDAEEYFSTERKVANWYFVREFCYASMFRYNKKGQFNIPYGGIAYNNKKLRRKTSVIFKAETKALFANTTITNLDFEDMLRGLTLSSTDFIFVDPPYDTDFSEYDNNAFTQEDQKRLANFLVNCKAKWLAVIKETDFVKEIYQHPEVKISTFDKNYTYNVKGRNNRLAKHLIITNY